MTGHPDHSVKVEIGAKAEASVKLTGEVPKESLGRMVDALTDAIRPFTEARGLKADHIRLQREEVALRIAQRARARIAIENRPVHPVPLKVIIPLLEKGSQEAPEDNEMIDLWAALLAAASTSEGVPPRFVGLLGELRQSDAKLFNEIWKDYSAISSILQRIINGEVDKWVQENSKLASVGPQDDPDWFDSLRDSLASTLKARSILLIDLELFVSGEPVGLRIAATLGRTDELDILESLRLVQVERIERHLVVESLTFHWILSYCCTSDFGVNFGRRVMPPSHSVGA